MNSISLPKLELLQVLRALAALAVVFYHTGFQPDYGSYGVWIFFVLSGVIMAMLFEARESAKQFIVRRFIRIVPLYWVMTTIAAAITWFMPHLRVSGNVGGLKEYLLSLFFIPFYDYNGNISPLLSPGWTLNYEIIFYVSCSIGLILAHRWPSIATSILVLSWWWLSHFTQSALGQFYSRSIVFLFVGGLCLWTFFGVFDFKLKKPINLSYIFLACALLAYFEYLGNRQAGGAINSSVKVILTFFIVGMGLISEDAFQKISVTIRRPLIEIGDASYAIYLTHLFVIRLLSLTMPRVGFEREGILLAIISIFASIIVGVGVHRYFDAPIQKRLKRLIPKN